MAKRISKQKNVVQGTVARDNAIKFLEDSGATDIEWELVPDQKGKKRVFRPTRPTFLISYRPAVRFVTTKSPKTKKSGPWHKPMPFYPNSKQMSAPGVRV